jgi:hypothetical protein
VSDTHDEIRALRVMVDELRDEAVPQISLHAWDAMEARLLQSIAASERPITRRAAAPSSALPRVLGFMAAAAAIALGISSVGGSGELPRAAVAEAHQVSSASVALAPGEAGALGQRDLAALRAGDVIEAGDAPVTFARAGLAAWTLAPGSVARVRSMGGSGGVGHTVALERGSIRAEVTPRDPAEGLVEAFAVEVGSTRVAVHGTAFSVTIEGAQAVVDVDHGAVAVGPVGNRGATTGHLLVGPSRAVFSLDGGRSARFVDRVAAPAATAGLAGLDGAHSPTPIRLAAANEVPNVVAPAAAPLAAKPGQPQHPAAKPQAEEPVVVAAVEPPALTVGAVRARLDQCFRRTYEPGSSAVGISISSTLRLELNADGSVRSARFDPPVKPELTACAGGAIGGKFADGGRTVDVPVTFQR